jgi:hypothetical protein
MPCALTIFNIYIYIILRTLLLLIFIIIFLRTPGDTLTPEAADTLVSSLGPAGDPKRVAVAAFVAALFAAYDALHFTWVAVAGGSGCGGMWRSFWC